jgi:predicted nucleotide-binding protein
MTAMLFLASSTAAKPIAKALMAHLSNDRVSFLPWWEAFTPGRTLLDELDSIRKRADGAVLVLTPESEAVVRGRQVHIPNLNVLFEFGFMYGCFQRSRVAVVKYGDLYLPSDLDGYIHIAGSRSFHNKGRPAISQRTAKEFGRWLDSAGFPSAQSAQKSDVSPAIEEVLSRMRPMRAEFLRSIAPPELHATLPRKPGEA